MSKPYVPHQGIRRTPITVTLGDYGDCQLGGYTPSKMQGRSVIATTKTVNGKALYVNLDAHPEIKAILDAANAAYERDFIARYPGVYDLVTAQNDAEWRYERLQQEIEQGDGILSDSTPEHDPDELAIQYPIAAAYLEIVGYTDSDNLDKYSAGEWAINQLEDGADVIETCNQMRSRWHAAASEAVANN